MLILYRRSKIKVPGTNTLAYSSHVRDEEKDCFHLDEVDEEESAAEEELGHWQPAEHVAGVKEAVANLWTKVDKLVWAPRHSA